MLPKSKRLNLKTDFKWVAAGQKTENNFVKVFFRLGSNSLPRIGIALSKSNFKKAVERNRARRLISKGFEELYSRLPEGINIIAMPKENVLKLSGEEVSKGLEEVLKKL